MGADKVLITASTNSNQLLHEAATISRKRGKIVLVGIIGREFNRSDFYEKELEFQVSCSYGAGRYDNNYVDISVPEGLPSLVFQRLGVSFGVGQREYVAQGILSWRSHGR